MEVMVFIDRVLIVSGFGNDTLLAIRELAMKQLLLAQHFDDIDLDVDGVLFRLARKEAL
jgi:hypothetical protein